MRRSRILTSRLRERVLVTTKESGTFSGVLYSEDQRVIVLRDTAAVGEGENKTDLPLDGELILFVSDVAFIQRP